MTCQSTQDLIPQDIFAFYENLMMTEMDVQQTKFDKQTRRTTTESRERSAEQLFYILELVALAVEGSDLGTTEAPFEPTARCINDTRRGNW